MIAKTPCRRGSVLWLLGLLVWVALGNDLRAQEVYYVATNAMPAEPYASWASAFTNLQQALDYAGDGDTLRLAGHTFAIGAELLMTNGLTIEGSYQGSGTPGGRDPEQWPTLIAPTVNTRLMRLNGVTNAVLDGFTLSGGYVTKDDGANLLLNNCSNVTIRALTIRDATAESGNGGTMRGAGMFVNASTNIVLRDSQIIANRLWVNAATARGAGMYTLNSYMMVSNCVFQGNYFTYRGSQSAYGGGAELVGGSVTFMDCRFEANHVNPWPGVAGRGGAVYVSSGTHHFFNCLITLNRATGGAGLGDGITVANGDVTLVNCTVAHNFGQGLRRENGTLTVSNSIVWANGADIEGTVAGWYNSVENGTFTSGSNNITADPLFERGYYLGAGSLCTNAGGDTAAALGLDAPYTTRADGTPDDGMVDLGYHYPAGLNWDMADYYVSTLGNDANSGTNWNESFRSLTQALSLAQDGVRIHVATGLYNAASGEVFPLSIASLNGVQILGTNAAATLIDVNAATVRAITLSDIGGDSRLQGISIRNARPALSGSPAATLRGAGLYAAYCALDLIDADFYANRSHIGHGAYGAGAHLNWVYMVISNTTFRANWTSSDGWATSRGGSLYAGGRGRLDIVQSVFADNYSSAGTLHGAGGYIEMTTSPVAVRNSLFVRNTGGGSGSGLNVGGAPAEIVNLTIAGNQTSGLYRNAGTVQVRNAILVDNANDIENMASANVHYSLVGDGFNHGTNGCFQADPLFVDTNHYHLQSRAHAYSNGWFSGGEWVRCDQDSPAIDAGDPADGFGAEPQPSGHRINLGAYGGTPVASVTYLQEPGVFDELTIHAYAATAIGVDFATARGEVLHDGDAEDPDVWFCWGYSDQGTGLPTDWTHPVSLGPKPAWLILTNNVTGAAGDFYYRYYASNASGSAWSGLRYVALAAPPTVENTGPGTVRRRTAQLTGRILDTGGSDTYAWFYYWPSGGATSIVAAGVQDGWFTNTVSGLDADTTYGYRIMASNLAGAAWSSDAALTTLPDGVAWHVDAAGDNSVGTNWTTALATLPAALSVSEPGDTIRMAGQTFQVTTDIVWRVSGVELYGGYEGVGTPGARDPATWPTVIQRQSGDFRIMRMREVSDVLLDGVTLSGGYLLPTYSGGGLLLSDGTNVTLRNTTLRNAYGYTYSAGAIYGGGAAVFNSTNVLFDLCVVTNNRLHINASGTGGAGLYFNNSHVVVSNTLVWTNRITPAGWLTPYAGGIHAVGGRVQIVQSRVLGNSAQGGATIVYGGGIALQSGNHLVRSSLIAGNRAYGGSGDLLGDGIYVGTADVSVQNCTIADNNANQGIRHGSSGIVVVTNCIVWGHAADLVGFPEDGGILTGVGYSNIGSGENDGNQGCISVDPLFVDAAAGNYRLANAYGPASSSLNSPCIDAGINLPSMTGALDLDGFRRVMNGRLDRPYAVDMGAYETLAPRGMTIRIR